MWNCLIVKVSVLLLIKYNLKEKYYERNLY
nr:MAG TPA: hypothetical protein [Crassvirales sp.]